MIDDLSIEKITQETLRCKISLDSVFSVKARLFFLSQLCETHFTKRDFFQLLLEETEWGILLPKKDDNKLSYEETYKAIAQEDWTDFDQTLLDGFKTNEFTTPSI